MNDLPIYDTITEITFCALPLEDINAHLGAVRVQWRGTDRYAVRRNDAWDTLGSDGEWDYEQLPSERTDEWLATHRFDFETACRLASEWAGRLANERLNRT